MDVDINSFGLTRIRVLPVKISIRHNKEPFVVMASFFKHFTKQLVVLRERKTFSGIDGKNQATLPVPQFCQKFVQNAVEVSRHFHHGRMPHLS